MGGKKKKSLANKLAKMSDEERARYLLHKAEIEEEAKRRKEQLVATFMKHMKSWIERVLDYKNRTISKLMEALEEAEEQYLTNWQSHATHIDNIIESQNKDIERLLEVFDQDLEGTLNCSEAERESVLKNGGAETEYLRTVLFGQDTTAKRALRVEQEDYMQRCYEAEHQHQSKLRHLRHILETANSDIWQEIASVVGQYVRQTDKRRSHIAELRRLDAESAAEIAENQEKMNREEELIETLKEKYDSLQADHETEIKTLELQFAALNKSFFGARQALQKDLQTDENQMKLLSDVAAKSLEHLEKLERKGKQLICLANTCKKFETERESVSKYLPINGQEFLGFSDEIADDDGRSGGKVSLELVSTETDEYLHKDQLDITSPVTLRPKTALPGRLISATSTVLDTPTPEFKKIAPVENITLHTKEVEDPEPISQEGLALTGILGEWYAPLKDLEKFWVTYSKVEIDFMEIMEEKKMLEKENKQMRGMIRAVLEATALAKSTPSSKVSTRLPSRSRSAYSMPPRRIVF